MFKKRIKKVVTIEGMVCDHCKSKVEKALLELTTVTKVKVNLKDKTATIYSESNIDEHDIINAITKLDYKVINIKNN